MSTENNLKSKALYKVTLGSLRVLPMIMVLGYFLMLIGFYFDSKYIVIPHILGTVLPPLAFIYIVSYVFRFCAFHRMFIHYYAFIDLLNVTDHYISIPISDEAITTLHDSVTIVFLVMVVITYIIKFKKDKCLKQCNEKQYDK